MEETDSKNKGWIKWLALAVLVLAQIGASADNSVLSVSTASLIESLNANLNDIQLANIVYSLTAGSLMIVGGMMGLIIGWNLNFRIGAILFAVGELVVALSTNIELFTWVGRVGAGLGASLMIPSVLGLIAGLYKGKDRAFAFGAIGAATGFAVVLGPTVAGFLIEMFNWRVAFGFMGFYFVIVAVGSFFITKVPKPTKKFRFDFAGAGLGIVGLVMFIIGISKIPSWGLFTPITPPVIGGNTFTLFGISPALPIAILGLIVLVVLFFVEREVEKKHGDVMIPSSFLKTPQVRNGLYLTAMLFLCFGAAFFLIVTYMQLVAGFSAILTGVAMAAMAVPMIAFSTGVPKFLPNVSPKLISRIGVFLASVSTIPMAMSLQTGGVNISLYIGLFFFGSGQGLVASQSANVIATAVNDRDAQQSGGIQTTTRNIGQAIGVAVLGTVMIFSLTGSLQNKVSDSDAVAAESQQFIEQQTSIPFTSDANFKEMISTEIKDEEQIETVLKLYTQTRKESVALSMYILGAVIMLFMFGTRSLPTGPPKIEEETKNKKEVHPDWKHL